MPTKPYISTDSDRPIELKLIYVCFNSFVIAYFICIFYIAGIRFGFWDGNIPGDIWLPGFLPVGMGLIVALAIEFIRLE